MDYGQAQEANALQSGLFDMGDGHGSSAQEPPLVNVVPWGVKERLTAEKTALGFYLSGHMFDEVEREVRQFVKLKIDDAMESREARSFAGIVGELRIINGQRGKLAIFKLDDKSGTIEATADEALLNASRNVLKDDELVIVQGVVQNDRFSGGLRLKVSQIFDLPTARAKYGKFLRVAVNGKAPDIARMVKDFPAKREQTEQGDLIRGLAVRLSVSRQHEHCAATAEVLLGDSAKFFPSDAALASWMAQAHLGQSQIVYD